MDAKEVFLNYYNFNPINPCNKVPVLKSKKVIVRVSEPGGDAGTEAPQHCLLVSYLPTFLLRSFRLFLGMHFGKAKSRPSA